MANPTVSKPFQPTGATQTDSVTGTAKTITLTGRLSDVAGTVRISNIGTQTAFIRLDGTTPTSSNAMAMVANTVEVFTMPAGALTIKYIAASTGSDIYVTPGTGA